MSQELKLRLLRYDEVVRMSLKVIHVEKNYNESISIGDILTLGEKQYVVIALQISYTLTESWTGQCVIQEVGSENLSQGLEGKTNSLIRFKKPKKGNYPYIKPHKLGDFIDFKNGVVCQVTKINQVYYSFVDLIVSYDFKVVSEWTAAEVDKAIQNERKRNLKLVKYSNDDKIAAKKV